MFFKTIYKLVQKIDTHLCTKFPQLQILKQKLLKLHGVIREHGPSRANGPQQHISRFLQHTCSFDFKSLFGDGVYLDLAVDAG